MVYKCHFLNNIISKPRIIALQTSKSSKITFSIPLNSITLLTHYQLRHCYSYEMNFN